MPTLSEQRMRVLLLPYLAGDSGEWDVSESLFVRLGVYLDLLLRWNAKTNLTAVREPDEIVRRHFGESLFAGRVLSREIATGASVLDLGSGAGFPGVPIQIVMPGVQVVLAESQGKKVAFLREVVRSLGLPSEVWAGRVEDMDAGRSFEAVTMRAVDRMGSMEAVACGRLSEGGVLLRMTAEQREGAERVPIPGTSGSFVEVSRPVGASVPRGT